MEWYYADNNERRGPVGEAEFNELIRVGRVNADTQVWRQGWADWAPLGTSGAQVTTNGATNARCAECGQSFATAEMVQYENSWVCPACKPIFFQKVREGIASSQAMNYAGFGIRFVAKLLDGVIIGVPGWVLQFGAMALFSDNPNMATAAMLVGWVLSMVLNISYYTWMHGKWGATVGKMACGLRVVTASGGPIAYGLAAGRFFAEMVSGMIIYIGYIMAAFDDEHRALHDRICNTRVIRTGT